MASLTAALDTELRDLTIHGSGVKQHSLTFEDLASADESFDWSEESESIDTEVTELGSLCLSASTPEDLANFDKCTYPVANSASVFTYGDMVTYDESRYSQAIRIDNVSVPPHLVNIIQRDSFDLNPLDNRLANGNMDGNHSLYKGRYYELTEYYNEQDLGNGKVETVLYTRKRTAEDDTFTEEDVEEDSIDDKGRFIQRTIWPSLRPNSSSLKVSPSKRRRCSSPTPIREPVFGRASDSSPSTTEYRAIAPIPQESVEFNQRILFKSSDRRFRVSRVTTRSRRRAFRQRKRDVEAEQDELRSYHGGLIISLITRLRLEHPKHKADTIANEYADAFEEWDEQMQNSPLRAFEGYVEDDRRRKWLTTMWEMPNNQNS